nr:protein kinase-like domain, phloem protein 2-like protein [Tanacetum cinerariifolium]
MDVNKESDSWYVYLSSPPNTPVIGRELDENTHNSFNRPKLIAVPRQRSDGWMEVKRAGVVVDIDNMVCCQDVLSSIKDASSLANIISRAYSIQGGLFYEESRLVPISLREEYSMGQSRKSEPTKYPTSPTVYTPPVTYPEEVEKTLGTPIEVEPLNEIKLQEVGLNCNHNTPLSSREVPSFDGPEPKPLLNSPSLDVSLGDVIGPELPIKPHSPDSSRMKVVDYLTTKTSPSPHAANSLPKGVYSYNF